MRAKGTALSAALLCALLILSGCARSPVSGRPPVKSEEPPVKMVHFEFDSARLTKSAEVSVGRNAEWMSRNGAYLILAGHCDHFGSKGYNVYLGDRRARAVKARMIARGVPEERILPVVSYGKSRPIAPGSDRNSLAKNRRVEFIVR